MPSKRTPPSMAALQQSDYGEGRDYSYGSPHLRHGHLRARIIDDLTTLVRKILIEQGECRVLEVGAGHGSFTAALVAAGAVVTVTEMSEASAQVLRKRFAGQSNVEVVHDPTGLICIERAKACQLVVCISVLHHIPDYLTAVIKLTDRLEGGAAFYCAQDPTWYPARSRLQHIADRGAYFAWRVGQGNLKRGFGTRLRRLSGRYDPARPSDMVEYHVVRNGLDQLALQQILTSRFGTVELREYWTTQSRLLQATGDRFNWKSTFSLVATGRRA